MDQFPVKPVVFDIEKYLEDLHSKEVNRLNQRLMEIASDKLEAIKAYNQFYSSNLEEITIAFKTTGQDSYTKIFPKTRCHYESDVKIEPMLKLAMNNLKNEFIGRGYNASFTCKFENNGGNQGGYIFTINF